MQLRAGLIALELPTDEEPVMTDDIAEYCPLCGDDFDKHRKTCRFEGTVHGSEVVFCRDTGTKLVTCDCERCVFDRAIVANLAEKYGPPSPYVDSTTPPRPKPQVLVAKPPPPPADLLPKTAAPVTTPKEVRTIPPPPLPMVAGKKPKASEVLSLL
jgi:hypothetical protein